MKRAWRTDVLRGDRHGVLNENATREILEKVVGKIANDIRRRDTFILFAAAHGTSEKGLPGWAGRLQERAIGQDQLQDWLANRIRARKAIMLDTGESGALLAGHLHSRTEEAASEAGVGRLHEATGRLVLTAAAKGQSALEGLVASSGERHGHVHPGSARCFAKRSHESQWQDRTLRARRSRSGKCAETCRGEVVLWPQGDCPLRLQRRGFPCFRLRDIRPHMSATHPHAACLTDFFNEPTMIVV